MSEHNPYAAPRSAVADTTREARRRPVLVWIITIFMMLGAVSGIVSSVLALTGNPIGGQAAIDYMSAAGIDRYTHLFTIMIMAASTVGYVELFRLKKRALTILAGIFAVNLAYMACMLAFEPAYRAMLASAPVLWSTIAGYGINLAILGYMWWLRRDGVLR